MDFISSTSVNIIYLVLLILGLVYTVFLLVFGHLGGDTDIHLGAGGHGPDFGAHLDTTDGQHSISPISPLTLATFVSAFGAIGLVSTGLFNASDRASLVWAALGGLVFSVMVYFAFTYLFIKPQGSSEVRVAELAGRSAQVITPIPPDGLGEVALVSQGGRVVYSARSQNGNPIDRGVTVRVIHVSSGIAFVEPE